MSETIEELYKREGALGLLRAFGLDQILTEQDDPELWAAALLRHWHAPSDPELLPAALRFGVSKPMPDGELGDANLARSGMEPLEEWCFERVGVDRMKTVECKVQPVPSFMSMLMSGDSAAVGDVGSFVRDYLEVSRPSLGESRALVHAGMSAPLGAGSGETRAWTRTDDDAWIETDEIVARWLA